MKYLCLLITIVQLVQADGSCPCGYRMQDTREVYTHLLYNNFTNALPRKHLVPDSGADWFTNNWYLTTHKQGAIHHDRQLDQQYSVDNVFIDNGTLMLKVCGYSAADLEARKAVSVAGIQSKTKDMLFGSYRMEMNIPDSVTGTVATAFWYHVCLLGLTPCRVGLVY